MAIKKVIELCSNLSKKSDHEMDFDYLDILLFMTSKKEIDETI